MPFVYSIPSKRLPDFITFIIELISSIDSSKISILAKSTLKSLGEIEVDDIENFFKVLKAALNHYNVTLPMS